MKNLRNVLLIIVLLIGLIQIINAQTNVSGGIYSNTTWTASNSPYIVVDTVVVFPNVTLTIQPGVTVKFDDHKRLEIRQGKLIAQGTITDSITFTSNSANPSAYSWNKIFLNNTIDTIKFNYCNFFYAETGISGNFYKVKNSKFISNAFGLFAQNAFIDSCTFINNTSCGIFQNEGYINSCNFFNNLYSGVLAEGWSENLLIIDCKFNFNQIGIIHGGSSIKIINSEISHNQTGISDSSYYPMGFSSLNIQNCIIDSNSISGVNLTGNFYYDTIMNCQIKHNGFGLQLASYKTIKYNQIENNSIGIKLFSSYITTNISCNKICNNTNYDFYNSSNQSSNISNNYWCTNDSTVVSAHIYDGYDNINLGLITFMPLDTSQCYLTTGIKENEINNISFNIFPNPVYDKLTLILPKNNLQTEVKIYNLIGRIEYISKIENTSTELNILKLTNGIYIIELTIDGKIIRKKFCKQ